MALANYFDKTAFGIAQVLKGNDTIVFAQQLEAHRIWIRFSQHTFAQKEGALLLDLLTRLLARLYPFLRFECIDSPNDPATNVLTHLARSINPSIDWNYDTADTIVVNVGQVSRAQVLPDSAQQFFVGSEHWIGRFSQTTPLACHDSTNPFGAGLAACVAAANVFRYVFKDQLPAYGLDTELSFSVYDYSVNDVVRQGPPLQKTTFEDAVLVGLGAIGNAVVWALKALPIEGTLSMVDPECIERTNLQRYILATQQDVGRSKSDHLAGHLDLRGLKVGVYARSWQSFLQQRDDWKMPLVGVGLDSAVDRIAVQASLPKRIVNAWTQREQLGVSRHFDFVNKACLACLYLPSQARSSLSEEIAASLNIPELERDVVRKYLADHLSIDESLIQMVAEKNQIPIDHLRPYLGRSMEAFYSEVVCGGVFMRLTGNVSATSEIHVPSAFESALAGIFLAGELYKVASDIDQSKLPNSTRINLIRPLTPYTLDHAPKDKTGRCICKDPYYLSAYTKKWNSGKEGSDDA